MADDEAISSLPFTVSLRAKRSNLLLFLLNEIATATSWPRNNTRYCHCEAERSEGEAISCCSLFYEIAAAALRQPRNDERKINSGSLAMTGEKSIPAASQ